MILSALHLISYMCRPTTTCCNKFLHAMAHNMALCLKHLVWKKSRPPLPSSGCQRRFLEFDGNTRPHCLESLHYFHTLDLNSSVNSLDTKLCSRPWGSLSILELLWSWTVTITQLLSCVPWDHVSDEHNLPLTMQFPVYEEHSGCVL